MTPYAPVPDVVTQHWCPYCGGPTTEIPFEDGCRSCDWCAGLHTPVDGSSS